MNALILGLDDSGGDGLVCARHLAIFGYAVEVVIPKRKPDLSHLIIQCELFGVKIWTRLDDIESRLEKFDFLVDAIFGFSFKGDVRAPFDTFINLFEKSKIPIVSIDIPSGWKVDETHIESLRWYPAVVISLTAPKLCMKNFKGIHYCGGRFIPKSIIEQFQIQLPKYEGANQFVLLSKS